MNDKTTIPKTKINTVMIRYAELGNFTQVAREFGYPSYVVTRCWKNLTQEHQDKYFKQAKALTDKLTSEYVEENKEQVVTYIGRIINIRNILLARLEEVTKNIDGTKQRNILLIKEAANTLKTISSISEVGDEDKTKTKLDALLDSMSQGSTLSN